MKTQVLLTIFCSIIMSISYGQAPSLKCEAAVSKRISVVSLSSQESSKIEEGEKIKFISWRSADDFDPIYGQVGSAEFVVEYDGETYSMDMNEVKNLVISEPIDKKGFWDTYLITKEVVQNMAENGIRYDLRGELDEESINYIDLLDRNNLIYHDEYLEDYIQGLLFTIHPGGFSDRRPGNLNLIIVNESNPNAFSLPNGTIGVSTGLLSVLDSEDELIGVLSHEIAHFVGDHHVNNILTIEKRAQRAEFWAGVATAAAGVADAYMAANNDYYNYGELTYSTAVISSEIAASMVERFGMKFNNSQEFEADEAAYDVMKFLNKEPEAYVTALTKIGNYYYRNGNYDVLQQSHTHPSMDSRLAELDAGTKKFYSSEYQKAISFINTYNAKIEYQNKHFAECENLVDKNINSGIATEDDYILKALVTRTLSNDEESNEQALEYLLKAESLNIEPNAYIDKQKAITYLRLQQEENARISFNEYLEHLLTIFEQDNDFLTISEIDNLEREISWTKRMIFKI